MAADFFRKDLPIPPRETEAPLSKRFKRVDAKEKILGTGEYVDDVIVPGMGLIPNIDINDADFLGRG